MAVLNGKIFRYSFILSASARMWCGRLNSVRTINGNFRHVAFLHLVFLLKKLLKVNEHVCIVVCIKLNRGAEIVIHSHIVQLRCCDQTLL